MTGRGSVLAVVAGGTLGALLRVAATELATGLAATWLVLAAVNVAGSLAIGVLHGRRDGHASPAVTAGLLGGFTSFSGWALDVVVLWGTAPVLALALAVAVPAGCLAACLAGVAAGRRR